MDLLSDDLDVLKKKKEVEKLDVEIRNAKAIIGLERFKAWAALMGPIMTALTVLGTVYLGFLQLNAKSDSDEDVNWRQTIESIKDAKPEEFSTRHVATLLKPFLESKRYRTLAIGVTIDELPRIRDAGTFENLFSAAFPRPEVKDFPIILDLGRKLGSSMAPLLAESGDEKTRDKKLSEFSILASESGILCHSIETVLRDNSRNTILFQFPSNKAGNSRIPMDRIYFERCDFSGLDFSGIDVGGSVFDRVKLDNAVLNIDSYSETTWSGNVWWTAKLVSADLLQFLIAHSRPNSSVAGAAQNYRDDVTVTQSDWEANVRRLCSAAHLACTDEQVRAKFPSR